MSLQTSEVFLRQSAGPMRNKRQVSIHRTEERGIPRCRAVCRKAAPGGATSSRFAFMHTPQLLAKQSICQQPKRQSRCGQTHAGSHEISAEEGKKRRQKTGNPGDTTSQRCQPDKRVQLPLAITHLLAPSFRVVIHPKRSEGVPCERTDYVRSCAHSILSTSRNLYKPMPNTKNQVASSVSVQRGIQKPGFSAIYRPTGAVWRGKTRFLCPQLNCYQAAKFKTLNSKLEIEGRP